MKPPKQLKLPKLDFWVAALNRRTEREKQLIFGFLIVLVLVLDYALLLQPALKTFSEAFPKIGPLKQEVKDLVEDAKSKDEIRRRWEQAKRLLAQRGSTFIAPDETPALLENLSQQAQHSGVKIVSLQPSDNLKAGGRSSYAPLPISIKAIAGTHEIGSFLSNLETGATFFRVKELKISPNPADEKKHVVELSMETYKREK